ncbi:MAG: hypothetical protein COB50_05310 [Thiotrichales bacterium]|nr:MAG: hypothetical protein COB50_05310 [Thiotrichales bacterium]
MKGRGVFKDDPKTLSELCKEDVLCLKDILNLVKVYILGDEAAKAANIKDVAGLTFSTIIEDLSFSASDTGSTEGRARAIAKLVDRLFFCMRNSTILEEVFSVPNDTRQAKETNQKLKIVIVQKALLQIGEILNETKGEDAISRKDILVLALQERISSVVKDPGFKVEECPLSWEVIFMSSTGRGRVLYALNALDLFVQNCALASARKLQQLGVIRKDYHFDENPHSDTELLSLNIHKINNILSKTSNLYSRHLVINAIFGIFSKYKDIADKHARCLSIMQKWQYDLGVKDLKSGLCSIVIVSLGKPLKKAILPKVFISKVHSDVMQGISESIASRAAKKSDDNSDKKFYNRDVHRYSAYVYENSIAKSKVEQKKAVDLGSFSVMAINKDRSSDSIDQYIEAIGRALLMYKSHQQLSGSIRIIHSGVCNELLINPVEIMDIPVVAVRCFVEGDHFHAAGFVVGDDTRFALFNKELNVWKFVEGKRTDGTKLRVIDVAFLKQWTPVLVTQDMYGILTAEKFSSNDNVAKKVEEKLEEKQCPCEIKTFALQSNVSSIQKEEMGRIVKVLYDLNNTVGSRLFGIGQSDTKNKAFVLGKIKSVIDTISKNAAKEEHKEFSSTVDAKADNLQQILGIHQMFSLQKMLLSVESKDSYLGNARDFPYLQAKIDLMIKATKDFHAVMQKQYDEWNKKTCFSDFLQKIKNAPSDKKYENKGDDTSVNAYIRSFHSKLQDTPTIFKIKEDLAKLQTQLENITNVNFISLSMPYKTGSFNSFLRFGENHVRQYINKILPFRLNEKLKQMMKCDKDVVAYRYENGESLLSIMSQKVDIKNVECSICTDLSKLDSLRKVKTHKLRVIFYKSRNKQYVLFKKGNEVLFNDLIQSKKLGLHRKDFIAIMVYIDGNNNQNQQHYSLLKTIFSGHTYITSVSKLIDFRLMQDLRDFDYSAFFTSLIKVFKNVFSRTGNNSISELKLLMDLCAGVFKDVSDKYQQSRHNKYKSWQIECINSITEELAALLQKNKDSVHLLLSSKKLVNLISVSHNAPFDNMIVVAAKNGYMVAIAHLLQHGNIQNMIYNRRSTLVVDFVHALTRSGYLSGFFAAKSLKKDLKKKIFGAYFHSFKTDRINIMHILAHNGRYGDIIRFMGFLEQNYFHKDCVSKLLFSKGIEISRAIDSLGNSFKLVDYLSFLSEFHQYGCDISSVSAVVVKNLMQEDILTIVSGSTCVALRELLWSEYSRMRQRNCVDNQLLANIRDYLFTVADSVMIKKDAFAKAIKIDDRTTLGIFNKFFSKCKKVKKSEEKKEKSEEKIEINHLSSFLNDKDDNNETFLFKAVKHYKLNTALYLLSCDASLTGISKKEQQNILHLLGLYKQNILHNLSSEGLVDYLYKRVFNIIGIAQKNRVFFKHSIGRKDIYGRTPLCYASANNVPCIIRYFIKPRSPNKDPVKKTRVSPKERRKCVRNFYKKQVLKKLHLQCIRDIGGTRTNGESVKNSASKDSFYATKLLMNLLAPKSQRPSIKKNKVNLGICTENLRVNKIQVIQTLSRLVGDDGSVNSRLLISVARLKCMHRNSATPIDINVLIKTAADDACVLILKEFPEKSNRKKVNAQASSCQLLFMKVFSPIYKDIDRGKVFELQDILNKKTPASYGGADYFLNALYRLLPTNNTVNNNKIKSLLYDIYGLLRKSSAIYSNVLVIEQCLSYYDDNDGRSRSQSLSFGGVHTSPEKQKKKRYTHTTSTSEHKRSSKPERQNIRRTHPLSTSEYKKYSVEHKNLLCDVAVKLEFDKDIKLYNKPTNTKKGRSVLRNLSPSVINRMHYQNNNYSYE